MSTLPGHDRALQQENQRLRARIAQLEAQLQAASSHAGTGRTGRGGQGIAESVLGRSAPVIETSQDLTGRRDEEALYEQQERLRVILSSLGDAVLATDSAGRITFINPVAAQLTGWTEEQALGQPLRNLFRIINEVTREELEDIVQRVVRESSVVTLAEHTALVTRDGREIPIEDSAAPIRDIEGQVSGVVLVFHDVTEKRCAEEALRESEQRVRRKLDSILSPEGDARNLELGDIIDVQAIQSLMADFYTLAHMPVSIVDLKGRSLVDVGGQEICTRFHLFNAETCKHCVESDTELTVGISPGEFRLYKCKNSMWDVATPILVGERHLGNLFSGQFFFDDEPIDYELFRSQAKRYGFNEAEYMAALAKAPRLSRGAVEIGMAFLTKLSQIISIISYSNIKLARALSERDALADSLRQSADRLNRTQEIAHLGSWELDLVQNRLSWSDEVYRIFGLQPQEFGASYDAFLDAVHPDDRAAVDAAYSGSLRENQSSYEIAHRVVKRGTGEVRWVHEKCEHIRDAAGRIIRSIGMVQDITEGKRAEDALRESEERFRTMADNIAQFAWMADEQGCNFWYNRRWYEYSGTTLEEMQGWGWRKATHPDHVDRVVASIKHSYETGEAWEETFPLRAKDGSYRWFLSRAMPIRDGEGKVVRWFGTNTDITEQLESERRLRESEQRYRLLVEANPMGVVFATVTGADYGRITHANEAMLRMSGYSREEVESGVVLWTELTPPEFLALDERAIAEARENGASRPYEKEYIRKDGSRVPIMVAIAIVGEERDQAVAFVADLSERKQAEQALREAQKLESIGVLAGGIAHDFNNLLTSILGNASLLQLEASAGMAERLDSITQASERAAALTRQLLAYAGKGQFQISDFDVSGLVRSSADLIRVSIPKNVEIELELPQDLPFVRGDSSQIHQVFMNLVINAGEAIGDRTDGKISVTAFVQELGTASASRAGTGVAPGRYILIEVRDNGCGMDEETKAKIFDPFFSTKFTGRGLGLAAVQGIMRSHKGTIAVESRPGGGSTFTVYLPCSAPQPAAPGLSESANARQRAATILVVDDEESVRTFTKAALERCGHMVLEAGNGRQAIDLLCARGDVDLVLLDIIMPVVGGAEAYSEMRRRWPELAFLVASGYSRDEANRLGIPDDLPLIEKPYTVQKLAAAVNKALEKRSKH